MATQVFVINAHDGSGASDLNFSTNYAADANIAGIAAGNPTVSFVANGKRSVDIEPSEVIRVTSIPFDAGTAQVSTINLTAVAAGTTEYVKIINTTLGTMNLPMKTFEGADAAAIVALMTAEFAKSDSEFAGFSASASSEVITVTAPINSSFRLAGAEGVVIAYGTPMAPSTGTVADVTELYDLYAGYDGITNRVGFPVKRPASPIVAGTDYDLLVLEAVTKASSKDGMSAQKGELVKVIFVVKKSLTIGVDTSTTGLAALLNAWTA
jgi:hypothetical protein